MRFNNSPSSQLSFLALKILKKTISPPLKNFIHNIYTIFLFFPRSKLLNTDLIFLANVSTACDIFHVLLVSVYNFLKTVEILLLSSPPCSISLPPFSNVSTKLAVWPFDGCVIIYTTTCYLQKSLLEVNCVSLSNTIVFETSNIENSPWGKFIVTVGVGLLHIYFILK